MNTVSSNKGTSGWRSWFPRLRVHRISRTQRALIGAQGKALTVLATALQSGGHLETRRLSEMLGLFGAVVSEEDRLQGAILTMWADMMEEGVEAMGGT